MLELAKKCFDTTSINSSTITRVRRENLKSIHGNRKPRSLVGPMSAIKTNTLYKQVSGHKVFKYSFYLQNVEGEVCAGGIGGLGMYYLNKEDDHNSKYMYIYM